MDSIFKKIQICAPCMKSLISSGTKNWGKGSCSSYTWQDFGKNMKFGILTKCQTENTNLKLIFRKLQICAPYMNCLTLFPKFWSQGRSMTSYRGHKFEIFEKLISDLYSLSETWSVYQISCFCHNPITCKNCLTLFINFWSQGRSMTSYRGHKFDLLEK